MVMSFVGCLGCQKGEYYQFCCKRARAGYDRRLKKELASSEGLVECFGQDEFLAAIR
jgi:hypothetical protein